eukprot:9879217-Ditylum_brightwellii.AAC.1
MGQLSVLLISFMAVTFSLSIFLSCAKKKKEKRKQGEGYLQFFTRTMTCKKKRTKGDNKLIGRQHDLE